MISLTVQNVSGELILSQFPVGMNVSKVSELNRLCLICLSLDSSHTWQEPPNNL